MGVFNSPPTTPRTGHEMWLVFEVDWTRAPKIKAGDTYSIVVSNTAGTVGGAFKVVFTT